MKIKTLFHRSKLISLTTLTISSPLALSQSITSSFLNEEADIINTGGTLVSAVHFQDPTSTTGSQDPIPLIINGIPHIVGRTNESKLTANIGFEGDFRNGASGLPQDGSDIVQVLLSGIGGANGITMEITDLEIGKQYLFQTYWEAPLDHTLTITLEGETVDNITPQQDPPNGNPGGTLISYEFTASDTIFNVFLDRDDANALVGDQNNWLSGYSLQELEVVDTSVTISSITNVAEGIWELTLQGAPDTAYEFRSSTALIFSPGSLVENLVEGIPATGVIGGPNNSLLTTDSNGAAKVRILSTEIRDFVIAQTPDLPAVPD